MGRVTKPAPSIRTELFEAIAISEPSLPGELAAPMGQAKNILLWRHGLELRSWVSFDLGVCIVRRMLNQ